MLRSRPSGRALAALVALAMVLAACGGDDSGDPAPDDTTTTAPTTEAAPDDTEGDDEGDEDTTTTEADPGEDEGDPDGEDDDETSAPSAELSALLLTIDDLPAGFTADEVTTDDSLGADEPLCEGGDAGFPSPAEEVQVDFQTEDYSAFVGSFAGRFETDVAEVIDYVRDEGERCADSEIGIITVEETGQGDGGLVLSITDEDDSFVGGGVVEIHFAQVGDVLLGVSVLAGPDSGVDGAALLEVMVGRA